MGQAELGCIQDCKELRNEVMANYQYKNLEMWRFKTYRSLDIQFKRNNLQYQNINRSDLNMIQTIPEEYQESIIRLKSTGANFIDQHFKHQNFNICANLAKSDIVWKRLKQVFPNPVLKSNNHLEYQQFNQISQNQTKLYSVLIIVSQFEEVMKKLTSWPLIEQGVYGVPFYINGIKQYVIIDDYIPTSNNKYIFGLPKNSDCWMILVQKALAKLTGSYENIKNLSFQQIFEEITGIPAQQQTKNGNEKTQKKQSKQLLVIKSPNSGYKFEPKTEMQSFQNSYISQSSYNDQFIRFLRRPNYDISSVQLNYSKQESIYFRFNLEQSYEMSLRVSQLSKIFINSQKYNYNEIIFELAKIQENEKLVKIGNGIQKQRKTYLKKEFIHLDKGQYFIHIKIISKSFYQKFITRCSLVAYSPSKINFKQIINISKAEMFKNKMLLSQYYSLINSVMPSARGSSLESNFVWASKRGLLLIKNQQNIAKKIKMKLLSQQLQFQDDQHRQKIMVIQGNKQLLISLYKIDSDKKKLTIGSAYQIRIIP